MTNKDREMQTKPLWLRSITDEYIYTPVSLSAGNYRTQLYDKQREEYLPATQGLGMFVEVKDPDDKVNRNMKPGHQLSSSSAHDSISV